MDFIATVSFADEERMVVVLPGAGALAELQTDGIPVSYTHLDVYKRQVPFQFLFLDSLFW